MPGDADLELGLTWSPHDEAAGVVQATTAAVLDADQLDYLARADEIPDPLTDGVEADHDHEDAG